MIEKKIHYIWLGGKPKNRFVSACINSWHKHLPDYEIIEWNEKNLDIKKLRQENSFFDACMKKKLWAFASDYLRLYVLYQEGGIYFDTDIQVIRSLSPLLDNDFFVGYEEQEKKTICTAVIGAEKNSKCIKRLLSFYEKEIFEKDLYINPSIFNFCISEDHETFSKMTVYNQDFFAPFNPFGKNNAPVETNNTYTIHWYTGDWGMSRKGYVFLNTKHLHGMKKLYQIVRKNLGYYRRRFKKN